MDTLEPPVLENPPTEDIELYLQIPDENATTAKRWGKSSSDEAPESKGPAAVVLDSASKSGTPFLEQY